RELPSAKRSRICARRAPRCPPIRPDSHLVAQCLPIRPKALTRRVPMGDVVTGSKRGRLTEEALSAAGALWSPCDRTLRALLRGDGRVHPAVLHHAMRRTEAEVVHVIGNI